MREVIHAGMAGSAIAVVLLMLRLAFQDFWGEPEHRPYVNPGGEVEPWFDADGQIWPCDEALPDS